MLFRHSHAFLALAAVTLSGCSDPATQVSFPQGIALIDIVPLNTTADAFGTGPHFVATARDAKGQSIAGQTFTWLSSSPGVATLSPGSAQAPDATANVLANGTTTITAT